PIRFPYDQPVARARQRVKTLAEQLGRRCLAEIVMLSAGDTLALIGSAPELAAHLRRREAVVWEYDATAFGESRTLPFADSSVDHLVAASPWDDEPAVLAEL